MLTASLREDSDHSWSANSTDVFRGNKAWPLGALSRRETGISQGSGTCKSRQILRDKNSLISLCLGTADDRRAVRLTNMLWLLPSRNSWQPWDTKWRIRSRRLIRVLYGGIP